MIKKISFILILIAAHQFARCQTADIIIRAKAKDAKFIGTPIGGAYVIVRDHTSGKILAEGLTKGGSGNTEVIMKKPIIRHVPISDSSTAKFEVALNIAEPVFADIEVIAPYTRRNGTITTSTQAWLVPGERMTGDGIVVEIPGFIVDVLYPTTHDIIKSDSLPDKTLKFKASITMSCGCPVTKGGIWNADNITVKAIVKKEGIKINEIPLRISNINIPNIFEGLLNIQDKGDYELDITAFDPKNNNTGADKINFVVQ